MSIIRNYKISPTSKIKGTTWLDGMSVENDTATNTATGSIVGTQCSAYTDTTDNKTHQPQLAKDHEAEVARAALIRLVKLISSHLISFHLLSSQLNSSLS